MFQYFKLKYGFKPDLQEGGNEDLRHGDHPAQLPGHQVGDSRLDMNPILFDEILNIFAGSENTDAGRAYGVYEPNPEFLSNIQGYLHNRFLNIGIFTSLKCHI